MEKNWIKCDNIILLQQGAIPMHMGKGGGSVMEDQLGGKMSLNIGDI